MWAVLEPVSIPFLKGSLEQRERRRGLTETGQAEASVRAGKTRRRKQKYTTHSVHSHLCGVCPGLGPGPVCAFTDVSNIYESTYLGETAPRYFGKVTG